MPLLFPKLPVTQIFGANTDVGKTLLTTSLLRATAKLYQAEYAQELELTQSHASSSASADDQSSGSYPGSRKGKGKAAFRDRSSTPSSTTPTIPRKRVHYLKPISTGSPSLSDTSFITRHTRSSQLLSNTITTKCLYQYDYPVSPHLAIKMDRELNGGKLEVPKGNEELLSRIGGWVRECASRDEGVGGSLFLETAGGVHSPSLHPPLTQIDSLRPLLLPTLLIASPHLGGISTTISAYEALILRGYDVLGVMCLEDPDPDSEGGGLRYKNAEFLRDWFGEKFEKVDESKRKRFGDQARYERFWSFPAPPSPPKDTSPESIQKDTLNLSRYFSRLESDSSSLPGSTRAGMMDVAKFVEARHRERIEELESMPKRTMESVWWPFTQHGMVKNESAIMVIDSAKGDTFDAFYKKDTKELVKAETVEGSLLNPLFDGSASWFTQAHTHGHPDLTLAAAHAAGRYGHVLFPTATHAPALSLAEEMLSTVGKDWASRVFFSDNGSTGMEVALKMAMRASGKRYGWEGKEGVEVGVIGLRGGYHGDTIGSMDASEQGIFNEAVDWYRGRGHWFSPPVVQVQNGQVTISSTGTDQWPSHPMNDTLVVKKDAQWTYSYESIAEVYDVKTRLNSPLASYYKEHIASTLRKQREQGKKFGALVIEPICLGAAGMVFVDPLFQRCLMDVVRDSAGLFGIVKGEVMEGDWQGLPVVFDEVFSGLHRLSFLTSSSLLLSHPDILVNAKILTGGLLPLSTTMASDSIFRAFLHPEKKVEALLHGHSYTAGPVGCSVALKALQMVRDREESGAWDSLKSGWHYAAQMENPPTASTNSPWSISQESDGHPVSAMTLAPLTSNPGSDLWSFWSKEFLFDVSQVDGVKGAMAMGTVLQIELEEAQAGGFTGYASSIAQDFLNVLRQPDNIISPESTTLNADAHTFEPFHIHSRPLGNVIYLMTSLWTAREVVQAMENKLMSALRQRSV